MFESVVVQFVRTRRKPLGKCLMERTLERRSRECSGEKTKNQERIDK